MATNHYDVTETQKPGRDLMDALRTLAGAWDKFTRLRGILIEKKVVGANGSDAFVEIAEKYGYEGSQSGTGENSPADNALESFGEIDSAFGAGNAAITQMLNRHL